MGYFHNYGLLLLLNEISTIFMNISWFCKELTNSPKIAKNTSRMFYISFIVVRNILMFWPYMKAQGNQIYII